jgi:hypothetical protein
MALGAIRTVPYIGPYGFDALRDATLWGYAVFAIMVLALADRDLVVRAFRLYGWVVPVFAQWLPVSYYAFAAMSAGIDPSTQGTSVPIIFFKSGDMAVHMVGAIAFLVLGAVTARSPASILWRVVIGVPIVFTALLAGAANRGALLTLVVGLAVVVSLAPRSRNWVPMILATILLAGGLTLGGLVLDDGPAAPSPTASPAPTARPMPVASTTPKPSPTRRPAASPTVRPAATPSGSPDATESGTSTPGPSERPTGTPEPPTPPPPPPPGDGVSIANPGFESGPLDNGVESWAPLGAGTFRIVGEGGYRDTRFAEIDNTGGAYEATLTSDRFPFSAGDDIKVSLWAKAIRGQPIVEIYVNWYDQAGRPISSVFLGGGLATGGSRTWREVGGILTPPPGTTSAELLIWEAAGKATLGIDEVTAQAGDFTPEPPTPPEWRPATLEQWIENIFSVFGSSSDPGLEGTKQFRLAWWGAIVDYTVFGDRFWTGKGFGVNLADDDGFQATADHSLRAPHNSHITVLARMGVPGFGFWLVIHVAFAIGLIRAVRSHRRAGDLRLAAVGGWLLAYWIAMIVDTTFDPYLEGPQGGIWYWTVFGLGLVFMRILPARRVAA